MRTVLITGCSSGIGLELAVAFAQRGDTVLATVRDERRAGALLERLDPAQSQRLHVLPLDVTQPASVQSLAGRVAAEFPGLDVLVSNAGVSTVAALEVLDESALREVFETNFFGAFALTRALLPVLRRQGDARIVFVGAIGALLSTPYLGAYCTSKHALDCMSATLDVELRPFGIRVSSVHPGPQRTQIAAKTPVLAGEGTEYEAPTRSYAAGLAERIATSPDDVSGVVDAVVDAVESASPRQRYVVSSRVGPVLKPLVEELERLHQREYEQTAPLQAKAGRPQR